MPRRKAYSKVTKTDQIRADHVKGMGDVVFSGFQCLNPNCKEYIFIRDDELNVNFQINCPSCNYLIESGRRNKVF